MWNCNDEPTRVLITYRLRDTLYILHDIQTLIIIINRRSGTEVPLGAIALEVDEMSEVGPLELLFCGLRQTTIQLDRALDAPRNLPEGWIR